MPMLSPYGSHICLNINLTHNFSPMLIPYGSHICLNISYPNWHAHVKPIWAPYLLQTYPTQNYMPMLTPYGSHHAWTYPTQNSMPMLIPYGSHICLNISYPQWHAHVKPIWVPYLLEHILPTMACPC